MNIKKLLLSALLVLLSTTSIAQSNIWVKSEDIQQVIESNEFQSIMKTLKTDMIITNPLYDPTNPELQKVYQIECDCNVVDLYSELYKVPGLIWVEYGPIYEMFSRPVENNNIKAAFTGEVEAYDMNGNQVNLEYAPAGMYVIIDNDITTKIVKL